METLVKLVGSLLKFLMYFIGMTDGEDKYVSIEVKSSAGENKVVPFTRTDVPYLGPDHAEKVRQAELLFDNDDMRYKWLTAVHRLRATETGWIMDKSNSERKFKKWGLTHLSY